MRNTSSNPGGFPVQPDLFSAAQPGDARVWLAATSGGPIYYSLVISPIAKRVWLKVRPHGGLEVVVPRRMPLAGLDEIIIRREGWIRKHMDAAGSTPAPPPAQVYTDGVMLPYLGGRYRLTVKHTGARRAKVRLSGGSIVVPVAESSSAAIKTAVTGWYREMAGRHIRGRVDALKRGHSPGRITIKDQKTRWGSCSTAGNLNFSWRLVMAPPEVVDYIVIHELAHLERPDHSKAFWRKVESRCPEYRERVDWLKQNGPMLHSW